MSISRPCEVPGPILSTQVGRTSTLGSLLGPGARGVAHSVNCEQAVHSHFRALSVGAAHAIACDGRTRERMSKRLVVARTASRYSMTLCKSPALPTERFPENRLTSDHLNSHCRRDTWQATSGEPDDARDAAECARSLFSTSETASTASAGRPVRAMSKSSLRSSSSDDLRRHGKASHLGIGDDRPHAWQGCMSISGRRWRARMQIGQTGLMVYRF